MANVALYAPSPIAFDTHDPTQVANWAQNEFQILSRTLANLSRIQFGVTNVAPPQPRTGLLAYADGTNWNPGSGEGLYVYGSDGNWHFLDFSTTFNTVQYPIALSGASPPTGITANALIARESAQCGYLSLASSTALSFGAIYGDLIKINGFLYPIPVAGITGLGNTSVFVNGVAGQNLAANTTYYVYAFNNGGVITGDFSTTAYAIDTTANNVGVAIKSGDSTRSLIGLCHTDGSAHFNDSTVARNVLSWFNRKPKAVVQNFGNANTTNVNGTVGQINGGNVTFCTWGDVPNHLILYGQGNNSTANIQGIVGLGIDSTTTVFAQTFIFGTGTANNFYPYALPNVGIATEGFHTITVNGYANSGAAASTLSNVNCVLEGWVLG